MITYKNILYKTEIAILLFSFIILKGNFFAQVHKLKAYFAGSLSFITGAFLRRI